VSGIFQRKSARRKGKLLRKLINWFDEHLPVPEFYDDPAKRSEDRHAYFWFKARAREFPDRMNSLSVNLEENGAESLCAEQVPGALVFEDFCQIAVVPSEDVLKIK
jgi:hypothetical protein